MLVKNVRIAALLFVVAAFCGCRSPMTDYENCLVSGDYAGAALIAAAEIEEDDDDELMWCLMSGGASRLTGDSDKAIAQFDKAEDIMIDHDGESVFARGVTGAWAMITNDKAFPYDGGGQDRIMTCFYKAIDFAAKGNPDAARTEFNRAAQHQENWLHERRQEIADAQERMEKDAEAYKKEKQSNDSGNKKNVAIDSGKVVDGAFANADFVSQVKAQAGFNIDTDGILDSLLPADWMNPYVSHVTGVFRWLNNDECRNYLKDAASYSQKNQVAVQDFSQIEDGSRPQNQVWIWLEEGLCPKREEWRIDLPLILIPYANKYIMYAGMAFPRLVYRQSAGANWQVGTTPMTELVDMDAKIKTEFDVYFRGALTREITRTVVKIGSQVALGVVAENVRDTRTKYALKASQVALAAWAAGVTGADTRSWTTLPKKVYVARITRPSDGKVILFGACGKVAEVEVPQGNSMVFVTKPSAQGSASVRAVTYP